MVAVPVALHLARVVDIPLWLHVQDFEVGAAFATGLLSEKGAIAQAARNFEERMLRSANVVSSISQPMCKLAVAKGVAPERIVELRNWANHAEHVRGANGERLRAEWGLAGKTVALYSGNIANKQGLEIVIEAARHLAGRPDITFVVSGEGPNRRPLEQLASGMDNIQFRDLQPIERVGELLNLADIHLLPQLPGAADLVLPSKLGNMLASGRPIVATALPGSGIAHEIDGGGMIVSPLDAAALAKAVGQLADDPDLRTRMGQAGCARAAEHWESEAVVDRFEKRMQQLLGVTD
jgi:colanic acid biosynthesis glycosyl transferase WcaI